MAKPPMTQIDKDRFGPWTIVTGASSGIGKEFARQLAASGLGVVIVARRLSELEEVGQGLERDFGVPYRAVRADPLSRTSSSASKPPREGGIKERPPHVRRHVSPMSTRAHAVGRS